MFQFRHFTIRQNRCAMKVGTDGVLLGAWAELPERGRVLDIGTGTGLLALMAAQRSPDCRVTAVEVDATAAEQARENVAASPWAHNINIICTDVRHFQGDERYDCILSNPPYYDGTLLPPDAARATARHTDALSYEELAVSVSRLLAPEGTFSVVLPTENTERLITACAARNLYLEALTDVSTTASKPPRRTLLRFSRRNTRTATNHLLLMEKDGKRSVEYAKLTEVFYIK